VTQTKKVDYPLPDRRVHSPREGIWDVWATRA